MTMGIINKKLEAYMCDFENPKMLLPPAIVTATVLERPVEKSSQYAVPWTLTKPPCHPSPYESVHVNVQAPGDKRHVWA